MTKVIKQDVLQRMYENQPLIFAISTALRKKFRTVEMWISNSNHKMLTAPVVLEIIKRETGLTDSEILEEKVDSKKAVTSG